MYFLRAERFVFSIICALFAVDLVLVAVKGVGVDVAGYSLSLAIGGGLLLLGHIYRSKKREERMAAALISASLFILFSICGSVFNYMFLPIQYPTIDHALIHIDGVIGYDWRSAVELVAHVPLIGRALFIVYMTSLPQLLLTIIILGFSGDYRRLQHFLLTGVLGALAGIIFWIFFPSYGPSAYQDLPEWVLETTPLAVTPDYGKELIQLGGEGPTYLSPASVLGLIAFPSFHIFMAAMSVWFVPRYRFLVAVSIAINLTMIPAVLVQGGHHLCDIVGGMLAFAFICPSARWLLDRMEADGHGSARPSPGVETQTPN
ncbi:phosphatase PAP2 family protein [Agrobacterium larrymoorei]|uniref:MFS family permease n=1 Tax=Agrobacterium larrymoorei TaxID=160699 RepID=A0ABU0UMW7_9HYPH|nr:phosphatase PAP2 family protein [Agrobacterium larrymoorei]MDQ1186138.1 MFS family permease [Agrobacterium larrymoorei]